MCVCVCVSELSIHYSENMHNATLAHSPPDKNTLSSAQKTIMEEIEDTPCNISFDEIILDDDGDEIPSLEYRY